MNNNINNISFKSKFEVAAGIKNKFAYRYSIPKKLENSLKDKFEKVKSSDLMPDTVLIDNNIIERIGSDKTGYWSVKWWPNIKSFIKWWMW